MSYRRSSPEVFWNEVRAAKRILRADIFYEAFDSMSSNRQWIRELVQEMPPDLNDVKFFVYSQALQVEGNLVGLYKDLGVFMVNMGLDSGDETMLRRLKSEDDAVTHNKRAVELLSEAGIFVYASFVLGAPGETKESIGETKELIMDFIKKKQLAAVEIQILYPLFNSKAGEWLRNPDLASQKAENSGFKIKNPEKLEKIAKTNPMELWGVNPISRNLRHRNLSKDWVDIFCEVRYKELLETINEIKQFAKKYKVPCGSAW